MVEQTQQPQTPKERHQEQRRSNETDYQKRRRHDQEAENAALVVKGTRAMGEAERALRRAASTFSSVKAARGTPERHELGFLLSQVQVALGSIRRAKRGSLLDFSDPDLAMDGSE